MSTRSGNIESCWATVGGLKVHARVWADLPPAACGVAVVLVHGLVFSGLYMRPTAERLSPFYKVFAPDLPGFGKSEGPARALNVAGLADALGAWMDAAGLGRVVLVGNSMGCQVVADLAARAPERVAAVVLTGPTVDPAGRTLSEQFRRLLVDATRERPSLALPLLRGFLEAGPKRSWQTARHALEDRIEENLPRIHAPALVVRGARDPVTPQAWAERAAALLPRGRLALVPRGPHALNYSKPDELVTLLREFIEREAPVT